MNSLICEEENLKVDSTFNGEPETTAGLKWSLLTGNVT